MLDTVRSLWQRFQGSFLGRLIRKYGEDQAASLATIIAYNTLFSMFPIVLSLVTIIGVVLQNPRVQQEIFQIIVAAFPNDPQVTETLRTGLATTSNYAGVLGIISFILLVISASSLFGAMELAFNTVFGVQGRPFWQQKIVGFILIFVFASLLVISILASSLTTLIAQFSDQLFGLLGLDVGASQLVIGWAISFLAALILFLTLFWVVPNRHFTFKQVLPGAVLAAVAFVVVNSLFPLYANAFGNFNRYGASFGLALLLLTYFSFIGQVLLIGAEVNSVLIEREEGVRQPAPGTRPLREASIERAQRMLAARMASLTPSKPGQKANAAQAGGGGVPRRLVPLGIIGGMTAVWLLLRRLGGHAAGERA